MASTRTTTTSETETNNLLAIRGAVMGALSLIDQSLGTGTNNSVQQGGGAQDGQSRLSADARKRIANAQKKRWAKQREENAQEHQKTNQQKPQKAQKGKAMKAGA